MEVDHKPACTNCAISKLAQKCAGCGVPIVGQMITVLEQNWHPDCLKCSVCSLVLTNDQKIYKKDNDPVCPGCVQSVFNMILPDTKEQTPLSPPSRTPSQYRGNGMQNTPRQRGSRRGSHRGSPRGSMQRQSRDGSPRGSPRGPSRGSPRGAPPRGTPRNSQRNSNASPGRMNRGSPAMRAQKHPPPTSQLPKIPTDMPSTIPEGIGEPNPARRSRRSIRLTKKEKRKTQLPVRTKRSMEEILSNINYILADDRSTNALLDFMIADYSVENLLFYLDALQFNELDLSVDDMKIYSKSICNKYFTPGGDMEVNISDSIRRNITAKLATPDRDMFQTACGDIVRLMELCTLPRFLRSSQVARLKEQYPSPSS